MLLLAGLALDYDVHIATASERGRLCVLRWLRLFPQSGMGANEARTSKSGASELAREERLLEELWSRRRKDLVSRPGSSAALLALGSLTCWPTKPKPCVEPTGFSKYVLEEDGCDEPLGWLCCADDEAEVLAIGGRSTSGAIVSHMIDGRNQRLMPML